MHEVMSVGCMCVQLEIWWRLAGTVPHKRWATDPDPVFPFPYAYVSLLISSVKRSEWGVIGSLVHIATCHAVMCREECKHTVTSSSHAPYTGLMDGCGLIRVMQGFLCVCGFYVSLLDLCSLTLC